MTSKSNIIKSTFYNLCDVYVLDKSGKESVTVQTLLLNTLLSLIMTNKGDVTQYLAKLMIKEYI